jgi:hypothetical protein
MNWLSIMWAIIITLPLSSSSSFVSFSHFNPFQSTRPWERKFGDTGTCEPLVSIQLPYVSNVCHGRDLMVVGFTTTYAIIAYHHKRCEFKSRSMEVYTIQHYVIKFVSDLPQVSGFFQVLRFSPPKKLTATM